MVNPELTAAIEKYTEARRTGAQNASRLLDEVYRLMPKIVTNHYVNRTSKHIVWPGASATTDPGGQPMKHIKRNAPTLCQHHQDELNDRAVEVAEAFDAWIADESGNARPNGKDSMHNLLDACSELTMAL